MLISISTGLLLWLSQTSTVKIIVYTLSNSKYSLLCIFVFITFSYSCSSLTVLFPSRYDTVATGVVFYHRFFMMQSFQEFNRWVVAAACLLLAGKVEETPKQCKVRSKPQGGGFYLYHLLHTLHWYFAVGLHILFIWQVILKEMRSLLNNHQWAGFGTNPKEELITHEKILLQTIKFDLQIEHPYSFILKFAKELKGSGTSWQRDCCS